MSKHLAISAQGLSKHYQLSGQQISVLNDFNLEVEAGQWVIISGQSGSGKTTALYLLGTLDQADSGDIRFFGQGLTGMGTRARARLRRESLGFVFQSYHLLPELSAIENVVMAGRLNKMPIGDCETRASALLEQVGVAHRKQHRPTELSGGEQQRVAIARALINDPKIILADEPTGNLDDTNSKEIMAIFQQLRDDQGKTIVMVTHDMQLQSYADRSHVLRNGRVES